MTPGETVSYLYFHAMSFFYRKKTRVRLEEIQETHRRFNYLLDFIHGRGLSSYHFLHKEMPVPSKDYDFFLHSYEVLILPFSKGLSVLNFTFEWYFCFSSFKRQTKQTAVNIKKINL